MSSSSFSGLARDLKKQIERSAQQDLNRMARKGQPAFDRVFNLYQGQPVETVLPHLRSALRSAGITPDHRQLRDLAQHVSDGNPVRFSAAKVRL